MKKLLTIFLIFYGLSVPALAQVPPPLMRTIAVSGEASEQVAPDQAILSLSLVNKNVDLNVAKQENDKRAEKLVTITREFEIPKEKVATSQIYIAPEYRYLQNGQQEFQGYVVTRSLRITIDKISIQEKLLSAVVAAKIDQIGGVEFTLADRESHVGKVRIKAFENARAKAQALASVAGMTLGKPISISAGAAAPQPPYPMPMMMKTEAAGMAADSVAPSLPGMISLSESVQVVFGLE